MLYDFDHPDVTLSDWQAFHKEFPPHLIAEVIDRSQLDLPDNFLPLAGGLRSRAPHCYAKQAIVLARVSRPVGVKSSLIVSSMS